MVLPLIPMVIITLGGLAILAGTVSGGFKSPAETQAIATSIKEKGTPEQIKAAQATSSSESVNALAGLYQRVSTQETGKEKSSALEASGGGIGGSPAVKTAPSIDTSGIPTGIAKTDDANKSGGINIGTFMPALQLLIIGIFAFLIIKELI